MNWTKGRSLAGLTEVDGLISEDGRLFLTTNRKSYPGYPWRIGCNIVHGYYGFGKNVELSTAFLIDIEPVRPKLYRGDIPSQLAERILIASCRYSVFIEDFTIEDLKRCASKERTPTRCPLTSK